MKYSVIILEPAKDFLVNLEEKDFQTRAANLRKQNNEALK